MFTGICSSGDSDKWWHCTSYFHEKKEINWSTKTFRETTVVTKPGVEPKSGTISTNSADSKMQFKVYATVKVIQWLSKLHEVKYSLDERIDIWMGTYIVWLLTGCFPLFIFLVICQIIILFYQNISTSNQVNIIFERVKCFWCVLYK